MTPSGSCKLSPSREWEMVSQHGIMDRPPTTRSLSTKRKRQAGWDPSRCEIACTSALRTISLEIYRSRAAIEKLNLHNVAVGTSRKAFTTLEG